MDKEIRKHQVDMLYHFSKRGNINKTTGADNEGGVVLRSTADDNKNWIINTEAANCDVEDTRRLDRYSLEYLLTLTRGTRILLLVIEEYYHLKFPTERSDVNHKQNLPSCDISGQKYIQLKCKLSDVTTERVNLQRRML